MTNIHYINCSCLITKLSSPNTKTYKSRLYADNYCKLTNLKKILITIIELLDLYNNYTTPQHTVCSQTCSKQHLLLAETNHVIYF